MLLTAWLLKRLFPFGNIALLFKRLFPLLLITLLFFVSCTLHGVTCCAVLNAMYCSCFCLVATAAVFATPPVALAVDSATVAVILAVASAPSVSG